LSSRLSAACAVRGNSAAPSGQASFHAQPARRWLMTPAGGTAVCAKGSMQVNIEKKRCRHTVSSAAEVAECWRRRRHGNMPPPEFRCHARQPRREGA